MSRPSRPSVDLAGVLLVAILVLALALRLKGVSWGLPYSFVNSDESTVVPKAFSAANGHPNPRFFFYPSLYFYLVAGLYLLAAPVWWLLGHGSLLAETSFVVDPGPYYLLARLFSVAMGTASVYLLYRLGRDAFGRPAGLLAALFLTVVPLHVAYSHMAVTDVTAVALSLLALVLLYRAAAGEDALSEGGPADGRAAGGAVAGRARRRRLLVLGMLAAGLATSTKYNFGVLVLPGTVAAVFACGEEAAARVAAGGRRALVWLRLLATRVYAPMIIAFVLASPFVLLDARCFVSDVLRQFAIMERGWLGFEHTGNGLWYNITPNLTGAIGLVLLGLGAAGLCWASWRRTRLDLLIVPYVVVYFVYIGTWKELADRYLLLIIPLILLAAARLCVEAAVRVGPRLRMVAVPAGVVMVALALAPPLADSIAFDRALSGTDTRVVAKSWVEQNLPEGAHIAVENYTAPLVRLRDLEHYREAGLHQTAYRILLIKLPAPDTPDRHRRLGRLRRRGVEYVLVSSSVSERVLAAPDAYPTAVAFYHRLDDEATLVREFRPGPGRPGPVLRLYRIS